MAFDYGIKRTGIAVTDMLGMIATPLESIDSASIFEFIDRYLKKENVSGFVVGEPRRLSGEVTHASEPADNFAKKLSELYPSVPVFRIDERFTSKMASRTIAGSGISKEKRKQKGLTDKVSAVLILQSYLENIDFIKAREGK